MNGSVDETKGETSEAFTQRALATIRAAKRRNVIVDFRYNWGGSFLKALPLVKGVAAMSRRDGNIYLLIGPNTFSAD